MGKTRMLVKSLMTSLGLPKKFEGRIWPQLRMWSAISTVNSPPPPLHLPLPLSEGNN